MNSRLECSVATNDDVLISHIKSNISLGGWGKNCSPIIYSLGAQFFHIINYLQVFLVIIYKQFWNYWFSYSFHSSFKTSTIVQFTVCLKLWEQQTCDCIWLRLHESKRFSPCLWLRLCDFENIWLWLYNFPKALDAALKPEA